MYKRNLTSANFRKALALKGRSKGGSGLTLTTPVSFDIQIEKQYSISMPNREPAKADVLQGTLDLMVLQTLASLGPLHGYAIAARLEQVSSGAIRLNMGTLYPALMRLEQRGLLRGEWRVTDNNRRARFYQITPAGRRQLVTEKAEWDLMVAIMRALLHRPA